MSRQWYAELDKLLEEELGLQRTELTDFELQQVERQRVKGVSPQDVAAQIEEERL